MKNFLKLSVIAHTKHLTNFFHVIITVSCNYMDCCVHLRCLLQYYGVIFSYYIFLITFGSIELKHITFRVGKDGG